MFQKPVFDVPNFFGFVSIFDRKGEDAPRGCLTEVRVVVARSTGGHPKSVLFMEFERDGRGTYRERENCEQMEIVKL